MTVRMTGTLSVPPGGWAALVLLSPGGMVANVASVSDAEGLSASFRVLMGVGDRLILRTETVGAQVSMGGTLTRGKLTWWGGLLNVTADTPESFAITLSRPNDEVRLESR